MSLKAIILSIVMALVLSGVAILINLDTLLPLPAAYFIVALLATVPGWFLRGSSQSRGRQGPSQSKSSPKLLDGGKTETGKVKWFSPKKGFGFITRDSGDDIFVHFRSIAGQGHRVLREGQRVEFAISESSKGLQAEEVNIIDEGNTP